MSMIGHFLQLTRAELDSLIANPLSVESILFPGNAQNPHAIDIDKAWHSIHFMLTGTQYEGEPPLSDVIFGGTAIGNDLGYGPARYLTVVEVAEVEDALVGLRRETFSMRYDSAALTANGIYPHAWDGDDDLDYVLNNYETLRNYYIDAASRGNAMLQYLI